MPKRLLEDLPDRRRICVMLRADGWSYEEIGEFLGIGVRLVRSELEQAANAYPDLLERRRTYNRNRLLRLVYLLGVADGGGDTSELPEYLDTLETRAEWLRMRMGVHQQLAADLAERRRAAASDG